jgi:hypothetical protein
MGIETKPNEVVPRVELSKILPISAIMAIIVITHVGATAIEEQGFDICPFYKIELLRQSLAIPLPNTDLGCCSDSRYPPLL